MRITTVSVDRKKKALRVQVGPRTLPFPFAKLRLAPSSRDPIVDVRPDPELGNEAFTYRLRSGAEDTIHLDAVLEVNRDPDYLQEVLLHRLTLEAIAGLEESGLGKRQVARLLGTSPTQLYRLLDPANSKKSLGQMLALLNLVDRKVELVVSAASAPPIPGESSK